MRNGKEGYRFVFTNLFKMYDFLVQHLVATGHFDILSTGDLPVVALSLKKGGEGKERGYDEYDVVDMLKQYRVMVPAYKMAPNAGHIKLLRVCLRQGMDFQLGQWLVDSLCEVIAFLDEHGSGERSWESKWRMEKQQKGDEHGKGELQRRHAICLVVVWLLTCFYMPTSSSM